MAYMITGYVLEIYLNLAVIIHFKIDILNTKHCED